MTATVFDIVRDALARVHAMRTATTAAAAAATRARAHDVCAQLETAMSLYTYPDLNVYTDTHTRREKDTTSNSSCRNDGAHVWLHTCSPCVYTLADMAHTLHAPALSVTPSTTADAAAAAVAAHTCNDNNNSSCGGMRVLEEQCRWLWALPDGVANALLALTTPHTRSISSHDNNGNALSTSLLLSSPLASSSSAMLVTTQPRHDDDDGAAAATAAVDNDVVDDVSETVRFAFDAALYHERLCDAVWLIALTRTTPHNNNNNNKNNGSEDDDASSDDGEDSAAKGVLACTSATAAAAAARGDGGNNCRRRRRVRVSAAALTTVVQTMVRCGVQRGAAAVLLRRLSALPASCLVMHRHTDGNSSVSVDDDADGDGCSCASSLVARMTTVLCGALMGAQPQRFALRIRHRRHAGSGTHDNSSNTAVADEHDNKNDDEADDEVATALRVSPLWHTMVLQLLQQTQQRDDVRRVVVCTLQHLLCLQQRQQRQQQQTSTATRQPAHDNDDKSNNNNNNNSSNSSVVRALARCVRRTITEELLTRTHTPRALVRLVFAELLWPVHTTCNKAARTTATATAKDAAAGNEHSRSSDDDDERSCLQHAVHAVLAAWGDAPLVRGGGSVPLHNTLLHAVMYALLYTRHEQMMVLLRRQQQEGHGSSANDMSRATTTTSAAAAVAADSTPRLPVALLEPLLRGVTLRMESVRAEALRTAALTVAAAFAALFVHRSDGSDAVGDGDEDGGGSDHGDGDVLHNTLFTTALSQWLAEEDLSTSRCHSSAATRRTTTEEGSDENVIACVVAGCTRLRRVAMMDHGDTRPTARATHDVADGGNSSRDSGAAMRTTRGTFVRRAIVDADTLVSSSSSSLHTPFDPDAPVTFFVYNNAAAAAQQQTDATTAVTRTQTTVAPHGSSSNNSNNGGGVLRPFGVQMLTSDTHATVAHDNNGNDDDDDDDDDDETDAKDDCVVGAAAATTMTRTTRTAGDNTRGGAVLHTSMTLRACYDALLGIGRAPNAQLNEVQRDTERGLRGLAACLSRLRAAVTAAAAVTTATVRTPHSHNNNSNNNGSSDTTTVAMRMRAAAAEVAPMVTALVPTLISVAIYAPERVKQQLLRHRHDALVDLVVLQPSMTLGALAAVMHSTRYGVVERVNAARVVAHAARALSQLRVPSSSSSLQQQWPSPQRTSAAGHVDDEGKDVSSSSLALYPPMHEAHERHTAHSHGDGGGDADGNRCATASLSLPRRVAITVDEGRCGVTRRWGAAARQARHNNNNKQSSGNAVYYNALADHAAAFVAALLAPSPGNNSSSSNTRTTTTRPRHDSDDTFWQKSDPYTPTAVLHALCVVLQCVSAARHVAPSLCASALPFCVAAATHHPHTAVRKQAWVVLGELLRSWCHAPPLYTIDDASGALRRCDGRDSGGGGGVTASLHAAAVGSLVFDEPWLHAFAALQSTVEALARPRHSSSSSQQQQQQQHTHTNDDKDDGHDEDDEACVGVALLVLCSVRDLLEGARECAWLSQQTQHVAYAAEL